MTLGGSLRAEAIRLEGLDDAEAAHRLVVHGPNALPTVRGPGMLRQLGSQFVHFFALILWAAAGLAWIGGMPALAAAIAVVVLRLVNPRPARPRAGRARLVTWALQTFGTRRPQCRG